MTHSTVKQQIDFELSHLKMNEEMKASVRTRSNRPSVRQTIAASLAVFLLGAVSVAAGAYLIQTVSVNQEPLPALDEMSVVTPSDLGLTPGEGLAEYTFTDYDAFQQEYGIDLIDSTLVTDRSYTIGHLQTDCKDFAILTVKNYIVGDTSGYQYLSEYDAYTWTPGVDYGSPITLRADLILSREQLDQPWDHEYMGNYHFKEQYLSEEGIRVNLIEDTAGASPSEKIAVFVKDGIRYTVSGRVSEERMKQIIESFH